MVVCFTVGPKFYPGQNLRPVHNNAMVYDIAGHWYTTRDVEELVKATIDLAAFLYGDRDKEIIRKSKTATLKCQPFYQAKQLP